MMMVDCPSISSWFRNDWTIFEKFLLVYAVISEPLMFVLNDCGQRVHILSPCIVVYNDYLTPVMGRLKRALKYRMLRSIVRIDNGI